MKDKTHAQFFILLNMKEKIFTAVNTLKNEDNKTRSLRFSHTSKVSEKTVKGRIFFNDSGMFDIELTDVKGYNKKYISSTAKNVLKAAVLPVPSRGDIVWTEYSGGTLVVGRRYKLSGESYYFGVGNSLLNCNGRRFYEDVNATYVRRELGTCSPGVSHYYQLFQLL